MKTLSLSEAKMKLSGLVDSVFSTDEEVERRLRVPDDEETLRFVHAKRK